MTIGANPALLFLMNPSIIKENKELLNRLPSLTGDAARLAHRLSVTTNRLEEILSQAEAQFRAGDRHATFSKQTIQALRMGLQN